MNECPHCGNQMKEDDDGPDYFLGFMAVLIILFVIHLIVVVDVEAALKHHDAHKSWSYRLP